jgi:hypothetical protein
LEKAFSAFSGDPAFAAQSPTREQVARAWAMAAFEKSEAEPPTHAELVEALRKMFKEFREPRPPGTTPPPQKSS